MLNNFKQSINQNYLMISNLCEEKLKANFNLIDVLSSPIQTSIKSALEIIEGIRINWFIRGISRDNMSEDEFISCYRKYSNKKQLIELIEKQRRTHSEIINLLCGCIIRDSYKENIPITAIQISEINFLIDLTANDFYNCLIMYKECKSNRESYKDSNPQNLQLIKITKSKLEEYGYATTNIFCGGDIALNSDFFTLMEQAILQHFAYEELIDAVIA